jgi:alpha-L-fucosidase
LPEQLAWKDIEIFGHLGAATWEDVQHGELTAPLSALNPKHLDPDQWGEVAVAPGAK